MTPAITFPKTAASVSGDSTFVEAAGLATIRTGLTPSRGTCQTACLVHLYPASATTGCRYSLGTEPLLIGRAEGCAIHNAHTSISRCHARIIRKDDGRYWVSDLGSTNGTFVNSVSRRESVLCDGDYLRIGDCIYRFLAGDNIEAAYQEEIYRLTIFDALTQTYNRRYFLEFLEREVLRAARHKRTLALLFFDIDRLQEVNDKLGHLAGDIALRELCARVRAVIGSDELLARYDGKEFALLLPEADADSARVMAERLRLTTERKPFVFNTQAYPLTLSVGAAVLTLGETPTPAALLAQAAANLSRAKQAGRNRVVVS